MESNEISEELREAERAAAAPYVTYPKEPWWALWALSCVLPLLTLALHETRQGSEGSGPLLVMPSVLISVIVVVVVTAQRKRQGALPAGKAPNELQRVYRWYFVGAAMFGVGAIALGLLTPLIVSLPIAFLLNLGGLLWFGYSYERAAARVRARLA